MMKAKSTIVLQVLPSVGIKSLDEESKEERDTTFACYTVLSLKGSGKLYSSFNSVMKSILSNQLRSRLLERKGDVTFIQT